MTVYTLWVNYGSNHSTDEDHLCGIFDSREKAEVAAREQYAQYSWYIDTDEVQ